MVPVSALSAATLRLALSMNHFVFFTGAGYHIFAGKEVSRALAKMSLVEEDCNDKLDDLTKHQLDTLQEWETKFQEKYEVVGKVSP